MASTQSNEAAGNELVAVPVADNANNVSESLITADEYRVGDVVWCKITRHPYWPARVEDPEHASAYALRRRRDGCSHFVTLFGEHTNAWCEPSQLVPFVQNFDRLSKAETTALFVKAVEEAARVRDSSTTTPARQRKRSKYLSPPYTDWSLRSAFKKGTKCAKKSPEDVCTSGGGPAEEGDWMNIPLSSSLVPAADTTALSRLNAIRQKLEVTSVVLEMYHAKFPDEDKASLTEDMNNLMEEVETMSRKVLRLAESNSLRS